MMAIFKKHLFVYLLLIIEIGICKTLFFSYTFKKKIHKKITIY